MADDAVDQDGRLRREPGLEPINSSQRQHPLKDRRQAEQHDQQFEKVRQTTISNKPVDGPKANGTDNQNNQNPD
ncbi:MAG: hypothetical protein ACLQIQ_17980 [Beijerinckiaceae bacterium]